MGTDTGIAWTDHTFNPWIGCAKVSPGCKNCYASVSTPVRADRLSGEWFRPTQRVLDAVNEHLRGAGQASKAAPCGRSHRVRCPTPEEEALGNRLWREWGEARRVPPCRRLPAH